MSENKNGEVVEPVPSVVETAERLRSLQAHCGMPTVSVGPFENLSNPEVVAEFEEKVVGPLIRE